MMNERANLLDEIAASQVIDDAEVAHCWGLVRQGIRTHALGLGNLGRLIEHLRAGSGMGFDELNIEVTPDEPERALVSLLDDERTCPASKLIAELEQLVLRAGGTLDSAPPPSLPPPRPRSRWQSILAWVLLVVIILVVAFLLAELERAGAR